MKRDFLLASLTLLAVLLLSGCATSQPIGNLYTDVTIPVTSTSSKIDVENMKIGTAECNSYLGLVATGDASIEKAVKRAKITDIYHVEWKANNLLGLYGTYKVVVYGK